MADIEVRIRNAIDRSIGTTLTTIERRSDRAANSLESLDSTLRSMGNRSSATLNAQFSSLNGNLRNIESSIRRNGNAFGTLNANMGNTLLNIGVLGFGLQEVLSTTIELSDKVDLLGSRLNTMADSTIAGNRESLFDEILKSANSARVDFEEFTKSVRRLDTAYAAIGLSQADAIKGSEALAKALQLEGATSAETASALLQVSQAFNKGKLDGDEFRSVAENTTFFQQELAKALGVTKNELISLSAQGAITGDIMAKALTTLADRVDKDFDSSVVTVSQSFVILENQVVAFLSEGSRLMEGLANATLFVADNVWLLEKAVLALVAAVSALALRGMIVTLFGLATGITAAATQLVAFTSLVRAFIGLGWTANILLLEGALATLGATLASLALPFTVILGSAVALTIGLRKLTDSVLSNTKAMRDWEKAGEDAVKPVSATEVAALRTAKAVDRLKLRLTQASSAINESFSGVSGNLQEVQDKLKVLQNPSKFKIKGTNEQLEELRKSLELEELELQVKLNNDPFAEIKLASIKEANKSLESSDKLLESLTTKSLGIARALGEGTGNSIALRKELEKIERQELKIKADVLDDQGAIDELIKIETLERIEKSGVEALNKISVEMDTLREKLNGGTAASNQISKALESLSNKKLELRIRLFDKESDKQLLTTLKLLDELESKGKNALEEISRKQKALITLLNAGKITTEQYGAEFEKLNTEALKIKSLQFNDARAKRSLIILESFNETLAKIRETGVDAMSKLQGEISAYTAAMKDGIITTEAFKNKMDELELERLEIEFEAKGTDKARADLIRFKEQTSFFEELRESGVDALTAIEGKQIALNKAMNEQIITQSKFNELQSQLNDEEFGIRLDMFGTDAQKQVFEFIERFKASMSEVREIGLTAFDGLKVGLADATSELVVMQAQALLTGQSADGAFSDFKETLGELGKNILKQIVSSFIQMGIQLVVNKALMAAFKLDSNELGKAQSKLAKENIKNTVSAGAIAASTMLGIKAISIGVGNTITSAFAPAATAVSLATAGANAVGATAGIAATTAKMSAALAASGAGFQSGGFTGNGATNRVAGVVHGQEFVVNAQGTARNRALLEAMNDGFNAQSAMSRNSASPQLDLSPLNRSTQPRNSAPTEMMGGTNVEVLIENNVAGVQFDVQQESDSRIRIIAKQEAEDVIRNTVPELVANEVSNPNSDVSQSILANTTAERRRA